IVPMGNALLAGMAVTSHRDGAVCAATFANLTATPSAPPSSPPAAPTGLSAYVNSRTQITLVWRDNSANETGFVVERSIDGTSFAQLDVTPVNINSYPDFSVTAGTHYWYRVAATNSAGISPYSNI